MAVIEPDSNPRPFGRKAPNLPMSHHPTQLASPTFRTPLSSKVLTWGCVLMQRKAPNLPMSHHPPQLASPIFQEIAASVIQTPGPVRIFNRLHSEHGTNVSVLPALLTCFHDVLEFYCRGFLPPRHNLDTEMESCQPSRRIHWPIGLRLSETG